MTVGELIKKLASYDLDQIVYLANLSDDSGDSDVRLDEKDIDDVDGYIVISHTPLPEPPKD